MFCYNTREYFATRIYDPPLLANTDFIIDREDGSVYVTRSGGCIPVPGEPRYGTRKYYEQQYEELRNEKEELKRYAERGDSETEP